MEGEGVAHARKIMVIRHAEKPPANPPPNGVDADGNIDPDSLTAQGWQRAGALVRFFDPAKADLSGALAVPNVLIASSKDGRGSLRPVQTLTPLAQHLHLDIDASYKPDEFAAAVEFAKRCAGVVLLCWQHEDIPHIGDLIAKNPVPAKWPGERFDLVWVFDRDANDGTYSFTQVPQRLLPGDLPTIVH